ncbi:MAG: hypothetical protein AAFO07_18280, partial [Bacteroidota bacterium]
MRKAFFFLIASFIIFSCQPTEQPDESNATVTNNRSNEPAVIAEQNSDWEKAIQEYDSKIESEPNNPRF